MSVTTSSALRSCHQSFRAYLWNRLYNTISLNLTKFAKTFRILRPTSIKTFSHRNPRTLSRLLHHWCYHTFCAVSASGKFVIDGISVKTEELRLFRNYFVCHLFESRNCTLNDTQTLAVDLSCHKILAVDLSCHKMVVPCHEWMAEHLLWSAWQSRYAIIVHHTASTSTTPMNF